VLDSPGGSIYAGLNFIQFAKTISNLHTISIFSASMAAGIVEGLPGRRLITDDGMLMFHRAQASLSGQVETGELEARLAAVQRIIRRLEEANARRMGISLSDYKSRVLNELWPDSDSAVSERAADKIIDIVCSTELINKKTKTIHWTFFGSTTVSFSHCPLFREPVNN
jgi:ATP-dependent protease ClpP protease subunit